jgi:hypothetical protein
MHLSSRAKTGSVFTAKKGGRIARVSQRIQHGEIEHAPPPFKAFRNFSDETVTVGIASFPGRVDNLRYCVDSLYEQSDYICVYLNAYSEIPDFLKRDKILTFLSSSYIDLNAIGKVFFIDWVSDGYYFSVDDDFVYPSDYISRLRSKIELYGRRCAVTVHGSIFPADIQWYYERTALYQYQAPLSQDRFVHLPGSGSFGFHKSTLRANLEDFLPQVMVDLTFAILCKRQRIPIVCVSRPSMWMMNTERSGLFQKFVKVMTHHTLYAIKEKEWTFASYASYAEEIVTELFGDSKPEQLLRLGLDLDFIIAARAGLVPNSWNHTMATMRRKSDAMISDFNK